MQLTYSDVMRRTIPGFLRHPAISIPIALTPGAYFAQRGNWSVAAVLAAITVPNTVGLSEFIQILTMPVVFPATLLGLKMRAALEGQHMLWTERVFLPPVRQARWETGRYTRLGPLLQATSRTGGIERRRDQITDAAEHP
jgi:hypothetical protein